MIKKLLGGAKSLFSGTFVKVLSAVVLALLLVLGVAYWRLDSLLEDNQSLRVANQKYQTSLEDADKTIENQRRDIKRLESIGVSVRERKDEIDKDRTSLQKALEEAIDSDKEFKECMGVKLPPAYLEEIRSD